MSLILPEPGNAQRLGFGPSPADDGGAPARSRIFSALKYVAMLNEIMALQRAAFVPIVAGEDLSAGPVLVTGYQDGSGFLVNGAVLAGAQSIDVDTGSAQWFPGSIFTIAGVTMNGDGDLQPFVSMTSLSGAGTVEFTPPLPANAADNAAITLNAGFIVTAVDTGLQANLLVLEDLAANQSGFGVRVGDFMSHLDASGASVGDPVYAGSASAPSLSAPGAGLANQIIGRVKTATSPALIAGNIELPLSLGTLQISDSTITNAKVTASAAIAGSKIAPDFAAQTVKTTGAIGAGGTPDASAILDAQSTTKGVGIPTMTTTQKNAISSPREGLIVYDITLHKLCVRVAAAWQTVTST